MEKLENERNVVPEDLTNLLNQLKQEIKDEVKVEIGAGTGTDQGTVTSGILKLTRSTNQLVNSLTITATAESENGIITYVNADGEEKIYNSVTISNWYPIGIKWRWNISIK